MSEVHVLIKCSGEGFSVESESLQHIENILSMYICESCMEELSDTEISLEELLWTACGAEFLYEKYPSREEYIRGLLEGLT